MTTIRHTCLVAVALTAGMFALAAHANADHPAIQARNKATSIDPNTFIVGHPASPRNGQPHLNGQHPAVLVKAKAATIDPNTFIVGHPASPTNKVVGETAVAASKTPR